MWGGGEGGEGVKGGKGGGITTSQAAISSQELGGVSTLHAYDLIVASAFVEWIAVVTEVVHNVVLVEPGNLGAIKPRCSQ